MADSPLEQLAKTINDHRTEVGSGNYEVVLDPSWLPVVTTLAGYLNQDTVTLTHASEATVYQSQVTMTATVSVIGIENGSAVLTGTIDENGDTQLVLAIKDFQSGWSFDTLCPGLPDSKLEQNLVVTTVSSFFYQYAYNNPFVVISTDAYTIEAVTFPELPDIDNVQNQAGIHFISGIDFSATAFTQNLASYLPEAYRDRLMFAGTVDISSASAPEITLIGPMAEFTIADTLDVTGAYISLKTEPNSNPFDTATTLSGINLNGHIEINQAPAFLSVPLLQSDYVWPLAAAFDDGATNNLANLSQEVFGENLENTLPLPSVLMDAAKSFQLDAITAGYQPKTGRFDYFGFAVSYADSWAAPYSRITLDQLGMTWVLRLPQSGTGFTYSGDLYATILIGDPTDTATEPLEIDLAAFVPGNTGLGWRLGGNLDFTDADGNIVPKPFSEVFSNLLPTSVSPNYPGVMNDLKLNQLSVLFVPGENFYEFSGGIEWDISESTIFYLDWGLELSTASDGSDLSLKGYFAGHLDVEDANLNIVDFIPLITGGAVSAPDGMNINLTSASLYSLLEAQTLMLTATSQYYGEAAVAVAYDEGEQKWQAMFGLATTFDLNFDLASMPLLGGSLSSVGSVNIQDLRLSIATAMFETSELNAIIPSTYPGRPSSFADQDVPQGLALSADIRLAGQIFPVMVAVQNDQQTWEISEDVVQAKKTDWQQANSQVGPLTLNKIGVEYRAGNLWASVDASLNTGPMRMNLYGFSIGSSLESFSPEINIKGLGFAFTGGPLSISGDFISKDPNGALTGDFTYYGSALISTQQLSLSAGGIYAQVHNHPSLFLFIMLNKKFGGPPYFFVNGIAAGFAYNRGLNVPDIDHLMDFPLVSAALDSPNKKIQSQDPIKALEALDDGDYVPFRLGQNWLGVGIRFSSFELVKSFALMTMSFGTDLNVRLMGCSTLIAPKGTQAESSAGKTPIVRAQMMLLVGFDPNEGALKVDARLTPASYVITPDCQLTGGFASYSWFKGDYAGDFVITLGGYSPFFVNKPEHYPYVPRLGINWQVDDHLSVRGESYFALTPTCVMVGGSLAAVWQSGSIRAWFTAYADLFLSWEPYHYVGQMGVSIGVSVTIKVNLLFCTVRKTFTFSLGADVYMEGPEFYIKANIRLWIASFTVTHGTKPGLPPPLDWEQFQNSFLPVDSDQFMLPKAAPGEEEQRFSAADATKAVADIKLNGGLVRELNQVDETSGEMTVLGWVVNPAELELITNSVIPSKKYSLPGNPDITEAWDTDLAIGPMAITIDDFGSVHQLEITNTQTSKPITFNLNYSPNLGSVPKALWGENLNPTATPDFNQNQQVITETLSGFTITSLGDTPGDQCTIAADKLFYQSVTTPLSLLSSTVTPPAPASFPDGPQAEITKTIKNNTTREAILGDLINDYGFNLDTEVVVDNLYAGDGNLVQMPILALLGQEQFNG